MKALILSLLFFGSIFAGEFNLTFSQKNEEIKLYVTTVDEKPDLAPLVLLDKYIDQEKGKIYLSIAEDKDAMCAQVFGKRRGSFFFQKEELPLKKYHLIINQKAYGKLYILDENVWFIPVKEKKHVQ